jgi:hypothetical protein
MKIISAILFFWVCATAFRCGKDDAVEVTKTDFITAGTWKYDNAGIDQDKNGTIDFPLTTVAPALVQSCKTDNVITFNRDKSGVTDEGGTKCTTTDPQTAAFNWNFADSETALEVSNNVFAIMNGKSKILTLTTTAFTLSRDTVLGGTSVALVVLLKH